MNPRLRVRGVSKAFLGVQALQDVSFDLAEGEVLALIGENGAGKSTLIRVLSGAQGPDAGLVEIDGVEVVIATPADSERLGIATVYQEMSLFPDLSVAENLLFGASSGPFVSWRAMRREAGKFLADIGLHVDVNKPVRALSVAEKQMLEIAKALHRRAQIVILDEPTAVLGGADVEHLLDLVRDLKRRGVSVIFVSHRLDEVFGLADTYIVLKDGVLTGRGLISETSHDDLVSKMVGREFVRSEGHGRHTPGDVVLEVRDLNREGVLRDVSFSVRRGEVVGIAGLRGAGRTELARAIFGADPITSGDVRIAGKPRTLSTPMTAIRAGVGLVPEERKTQGAFLNLSTASNIPIVRDLKTRRRWSTPSTERKLAQKYKDKLRIKVSDVTAPVATLSGGNQQKVVLAKWLEAGVDVLLLDEPTRGIDIGAKQEIYQLIEALCEQGLAIVLISSELPEVLALSDRILVMHQGTVEAELNGAETSEEEIMFHAVGGKRQ